MGHPWRSLPICNARVRSNINQPGSIPYLRRIEFVELARIIKPRERISDKGKLSERIGRKDTSLRPLKENRIQTTKMSIIIKFIAFYASLITVVIILLEIIFFINHGYLFPIEQISDFRFLF